MITIAFHSYQLSERGTEVALFDYARYNEEILGNRSIIVSTDSRPAPAYSKFSQRFEVILYPEVWNPHNNTQLRERLESIVEQKKIDLFYASKNGEQDFILPRNCKTGAHCVFNMREPHGDVYAGISEYLAKKHHQKAFVPYMVDVFQEWRDLREPLGIPKNAFVFGRHGGYDTFDIPFVYESIVNFLHNRNDVYFVFMNTRPFYEHDRIRYLEGTTDPRNKRLFVNTCDAMIHGRSDGETFGLAVAEFSICNKPVLTYDTHAPVYDRCHLDILGSKALLFKDPLELDTGFERVSSTDFTRSRNWDAYSELYNPQSVMKLFDAVFIRGGCHLK